MHPKPEGCYCKIITRAVTKINLNFFVFPPVVPYWSSVIVGIRSFQFRFLFSFCTQFVFPLRGMLRQNGDDNSTVIHIYNMKSNSHVIVTHCNVPLFWCNLLKLRKLYLFRIKLMVILKQKEIAIPNSRFILRNDIIV